jgi:hypothetical protein
LAPAINKLDAFLWHPNIQAILGQEDGLNMHHILRDRRILLVPLTKGVLGDQAATMFGALVFSRIWQAVLGRAELQESQRVPYFCILDEFQNYMNTSTPVGDILAEARGYGFGLVMAHQHLGQLDKVPSLKGDIAANARTKVIFQANEKDANEISKQFGGKVSSQDIQQLGKHEVYIQAAAADRVCDPASGTTRPPSPSLGVAEAVRTASRANYASDHLAVVTAGIAARHGNGPAKRRRPRIGVELEDESCCHARCIGWGIGGDTAPRGISPGQRAGQLAGSGGDRGGDLSSENGGAGPGHRGDGGPVPPDDGEAARAVVLRLRVRPPRPSGNPPAEP